MKHRWSIALATLLLWISASGRALAQATEEEMMKIDARLRTYENNMNLEDSSTALTWLLGAFLLVVCVAVLFKDAKRTHLD